MMWMIPTMSYSFKINLFLVFSGFSLFGFFDMPYTRSQSSRFISVSTRSLPLSSNDEETRFDRRVVVLFSAYIQWRSHHSYHNHRNYTTNSSGLCHRRICHFWVSLVPCTTTNAASHRISDFEYMKSYIHAWWFSDRLFGANSHLPSYSRRCQCIRRCQRSRQDR